MSPSLASILQNKKNWQEIMKVCRENARDPRLREFYGAFTLKNDQPIDTVDFVALDFETTGLNLDSDGIVSIGLVPFSYQRVYCNKASHWLLQPRQHLAEHSVVVHGITHSAISDAPDLELVLEDVLKCLAGKMIVVHYNCIERDFLNRTLMTRLNEGIQFPVIDTMAIETSLYKNQGKNILSWLRRERPVSLRLVDCRARYNLPSHQAHNALADAIATAELFLAQVAYHYSGSTTLEELWI
jgi:DNA polymerase III subunit epsilon